MSCRGWKESDLGLIPDNWSIVRVDEVAEVVSGGTPSTKKEEYYGEDISWITPKDLSGYNSKYISKGERSITKAGLDNSSAKLLPKDTILFSSRAPIGYVAISKNELSTNQGFKNLICNDKLVDVQFMYYKMKTSKEAFESVAGGSTFKEVSGKMVKEFRFILPSLLEQKRIGEILCSIDNKIELNNEMNKTLEEMAQALFKRWFVDFEFPNEDGEPYKSSGGEMVESELGMIPIGWSIKTLNDICSSISKGTTPTIKDLKAAEDEEVVNFIKVKDISDNGEIVLENMQKIPMSIHLSKLKRSILQENDILFSIAGTIGRVTFVQKNILECNINQAIAFIRLFDSKKYFNLVISNLKSTRVNDDINSRIVQGVQANISLGVIKDIRIIIPDDNRLFKFNSLLNPMLLKICELQNENKDLIELRNSLLPKLMSGEMRVEDIEANL